MQSDNVARKVAVIDTGAGNLFSLFASCKRMGLAPYLVKNAQELKEQAFDILVIPGQGHFGKVMQQLRQSQLADAIVRWYQSDKQIIAICVGMQIFFESSQEAPNVPGLSLLEGTIEKLNSPKRPMVGWCELDSPLDYLQSKTVYFVNSYAVKSSELATSSVTYGERFVSSIRSRNLFAFQFHPEKSGATGEEILQSCLV